MEVQIDKKNLVTTDHCEKYEFQENNLNSHLNALEIDKTKSLRESSIRGGTATLITQAISYLITIGSTVTLARLLSPGDYGLVAMVSVLTNFMCMFQDMGLSSATVQSSSISRDQISALYWINVGLGTLIMFVIMASAFFIAGFYKNQQLIQVTIGLSFVPFLGSLGAQHKALLNREMRFRSLALIQVTALLAGFIAALFVAIYGGEYWALILNNIVSVFCSSLGMWIASDFRPSWPKKETKIRSLLSFGVNVAGFDLAYYFHDNMDKLLIGRTWGEHQLGLYSRAYSLLELPLSSIRFPLNRVAFPAMSRLKNEPTRYQSYYVKYCSLLAFISMPLVVFLYICSENIIRLVLSEKWLGAVEIFRILSVAGFIQSVASLRTTVIMSSGQGKRLFRLGSAIAFATVVSFFCGLPYGAKGVAISYCIANLIVLHPSLVYSFKGTPIKPIYFYKSIAIPFFSSISMGIIYVYFIMPLINANDIFVLIFASMICAIIYFCFFSITPIGRKNLRDYYGYLKILFQ
jgi:polysaccharide transporter, PST family